MRALGYQADAGPNRPLVAGPWAAAWEGPHGRRAGAGAPAPQTWAMGVPLAGQASMPSFVVHANPYPSSHGGALPSWPPPAAPAAPPLNPYPTSYPSSKVPTRAPDAACAAPLPLPPLPGMASAPLPGVMVAPLRRMASGGSLLSTTSSDASSGELGASSGEDEPVLAPFGGKRSVPASPSSVLVGPYRRAAASAAALDAPKLSGGRVCDPTFHPTLHPTVYPSLFQAPLAKKAGGGGGHSRSASGGSTSSVDVVGEMAGRAGCAAGDVGAGLGLPPAEAAAAAAKGLGPLSALPSAPAHGAPNPSAGAQSLRCAAGKWAGALPGDQVVAAPLPQAQAAPGGVKPGVQTASCLADASSRCDLAFAAPPAPPTVALPELPHRHKRRPTLRRRLLRLLFSSHRPRPGGH